MHVISARNVHEAIPEGCYQMSIRGLERNSRNGKVKVLPVPLTTVYREPIERVEFHPDRDSNPFFHLMECLWMLDGRNDVAFVDQFSSGISRYSDDGVTINGAYGHRWRTWFGLDQLEAIVEALQTNPDCRRQVLGMWDAGSDLGNRSKDVPCNTTAFLQIGVSGALDLMVCNRSNDLIWGAYGANAVHFSALLEYVAARLEVPIGRYYQTSMNTHVYERHFDLVEELAQQAPMPPAEMPWSPYRMGVQPTPLMDPDMGAWHHDLAAFMSRDHFNFETPVFRMLDIVREAYLIFKDKTNPGRHIDALDEIHRLPDNSDWRQACEAWLLRRLARSLP